MVLCQKKQRHCGPEEAEGGDIWDHVAIDPVTKLVVALEVGQRTQEQTGKLVQQVKERLAPGWLPAFFSDAYEAYPQALLETFGNRYPVPRQGSKGRRPNPVVRCPRGLVYAQVKKHYQGWRVKGVEIRPIFGKGKLAPTLKKLGFHQVNTSAIERHNGTSRAHDRRLTRKSLAFSRERRYHRWMRWLATTLYNFCWDHSSLKQRQEGEFLHQSPAQAAGLTDHIWSLQEWLLCPVLGR